MFLCSGYSGYAAVGNLGEWGWGGLRKDYPHEGLLQKDFCALSIVFGNWCIEGTLNVT